MNFLNKLFIPIATAVTVGAVATYKIITDAEKKAKEKARKEKMEAIHKLSQVINEVSKEKESEISKEIKSNTNLREALENMFQNPSPKEALHGKWDASIKEIRENIHNISEVLSETVAKIRAEAKTKEDSDEIYRLSEEKAEELMALQDMIAEDAAVASIVKPYSATPKNDNSFVINTKTKKYHTKDCRLVKKNFGVDGNYQETDLTLKELQKDGYEPCGLCNNSNEK